MTKAPLPEKLNPCEYEWYVRLLWWADTDCWCCSTTRGLILFIPIGGFLGWALDAQWMGAVWFLLSLAALTLNVALRVKYPPEAEGGPDE